MPLVLFSAPQDELEPDKPSSDNRTAICLVGSARTFEATGPSIVHFLVRQLEPQADLFLNSPMDSDSAKMWILSRAASVAAIRIFPVVDVDPDKYPTKILRNVGSPKGIQVSALLAPVGVPRGPDLSRRERGTPPESCAPSAHPRADRSMPRRTNSSGTACAVLLFTTRRHSVRVLWQLASPKQYKVRPLSHSTVR